MCARKTKNSSSRQKSSGILPSKEKRLTGVEKTAFLRRPASVRKLYDLINILRRPGGCPWDQVQTEKKLRPHLVEEIYEFLEALEQNDEVAIAEEAGDALFIVLYHIYLQEERGILKFDTVVKNELTKLINRHPHVFGDLRAKDAKAVLDNWARLKKAEGKDPIKDLPVTLPPLTFLHRLLSKIGPELKAPNLPTKRDANNIFKRLADGKKISSSEAAFLLYFITEKTYRQKLHLETALQKLAVSLRNQLISK